MAPSDLLNFDEWEYRKKCASFTPDELRDHERRKRGQHVGTVCSAGISIAAAPSTFGISLVGAAYSVRNNRIAHQKYAIICEIMKRRGIEPYDARTRDWAIPVAANVSGVIVGAGVGHVLSAGVSHPSTVPRLESALAGYGTNWGVQTAAEKSRDVATSKKKPEQLPPISRSHSFSQPSSPSREHLPRAEYPPLNRASTSVDHPVDPNSSRVASLVARFESNLGSYPEEDSLPEYDESGTPSSRSPNRRPTIQRRQSDQSICEPLLPPESQASAEYERHQQLLKRPPPPLPRISTSRPTPPRHPSYQRSPGTSVIRT